MEEIQYCHECSDICEIDYCKKINISCCGSPDNFIYLCQYCVCQYGVSVACEYCCEEGCCNKCCKFITNIEKSDEEISKIDNILKEKINIPDLRNIIHELILNPKRSSEMAKSAHDNCKVDATKKLTELVMSLADKKSLRSTS